MLISTSSQSASRGSLPLNVDEEYTSPIPPSHTFGDGVFVSTTPYRSRARNANGRYFLGPPSRSQRQLSCQPACIGTHQRRSLCIKPSRSMASNAMPLTTSVQQSRSQMCDQPPDIQSNSQANDATLTRRGRGVSRGLSVAPLQTTVTRSPLLPAWSGSLRQVLPKLPARITMR